MAPTRTASFWLYLGSPPIIAGDRLGAQFFVQKIEQLLSQRADTLSESQERQVRRLHALWLTRAQGGDLRWNQWGSKPGRRPRTEPSALDQLSTLLKK